jgi:hypothetical protein
MTFPLLLPRGMLPFPCFFPGECYFFHVSSPGNVTFSLVTSPGNVTFSMFLPRDIDKFRKMSRDKSQIWAIFEKSRHSHCIFLCLNPCTPCFYCGKFQPCFCRGKFQLLCSKFQLHCFWCGKFQLLCSKFQLPPVFDAVNSSYGNHPILIGFFLNRGL